MHLSLVRRYLVLILPALTVALLCCGQSGDSLATFRRNLREDLPIFSKIITRLHPVYNKPGVREQLSRKLDSLYRLDHPLTIGQISSVLQDVNTGKLCTDDHTSINVQTALFKVWPYAVRIIANRIYINQDSVSIPFGAEVTSVNGRPVRQLLDILYAAGNKPDLDTAKDISGMEVLWPVMWSEEFGPQEQFDVDYKWQNKEGHIRLDAVTLETYFQVAYSKRVFPSQFWKDKWAGMANYDIHRDSRGSYLCLNTFNYPTDSLKRHLDWFFGQLRTDSINLLLIDLTHNGGGVMNNVPLLYSYLTDKPFDFSLTFSADEKGIPFRQYLTSVGYSPVKGHTSQEIDTTERSMWDGFSKTPGGNYEKKAFQTPYDPAAPEKRFAGRVFVFISGETHSAACVFSALGKVNKRIVLFGTPSGGKAHFVDAGVSLEYQLPNSGATISVPAFHVNLDFADSLPEDRCAVLTPDQYVSPAEVLQMFLSRNGNPPAYNKFLEYMGKN